MTNIKSYDEIKDGIVDILTSHFGPIDSEPDSNFGQVIDPFTLQHTDVYQQLDYLVQQLAPGTARGESQNRIFAYLNLIRHDATATTVPLVLSGTEGTIVPIGSVVRNSVNNAEYETDADVTITKNDLIQVKFEVGSIGIGDTVSISINSNPISIVTTTADSTIEASSLVDEVNSYTSGVTATSTGTIVTIVSNDLATVFASDAVLNTTIFAIGTPSQSTGTVVGKVSAPARSVNIIVTPVSGWDSVDNLAQGQRGRNQESDADFAERRLRSFLMPGGATPTGMQAKILNFVDGVSFCRVYENPTARTDEFGRPPHCVHVVAEGGTSNDIAVMIASNKAAGPATFGSQTVSLTDSEGVNFPINFDRPGVKYAWVKVTITEKNFEETFPPDGIDIIRQSVFDFADTSFSYGDDLIFQKFYTPVYSVSGIKTATVELAITDDPEPPPTSGEYAEANISIAPTDYTDWVNSPARIIVVDNS